MYGISLSLAKANTPRRLVGRHRIAFTWQAVPARLPPGRRSPRRRTAAVHAGEVHPALRIDFLRERLAAGLFGNEATQAKPPSVAKPRTESKPTSAPAALPLTTPPATMGPPSESVSATTKGPRAMKKDATGAIVVDEDSGRPALRAELGAMFS